jgi:hypothetical protein
VLAAIVQPLGAVTTNVPAVAVLMSAPGKTEPVVHVPPQPVPVNVTVGEAGIVNEAETDASIANVSDVTEVLPAVKAMDHVEVAPT